MASEIIVSINVKSGKAEVSLKKAKVSVDSLAKAKEKLAHAETQLAKDIALVNLKTKEQIQVNNQAAAATLKNINKGSGQFRTQVGLNNAILTEAGRAASDLRFGFNGVANNVGQIASLFGNLINTSDNVGTSLKNLAKSLIGTGGVMIAVQLLIAYGDQIYNFFFNASAAAADLRKKMESLLKPIEQNRLELLGYIQVLEDTTSSELARVEALDKLGKAVPDAVDDNGKLKISYTELGLVVEDYIEQLTIRAEIEAIIELNSEKFSKRRKVRAIEAIEYEAEKNKAIKKYLDEELSFADTSFALGETIDEQDKFRRLSQEEKNKLRFEKLRKETETEAQQIIDSLVKLQKKIKGIKEDPSASGGDAKIRVFKEKTLQLEKLEQKYREQAINKDGQTNEERTAQFEENELAKLDITIKNFIEREKLRLKNYKESVAKLKISNKKKAKLIADAEAKFTNEIKIAGEDRLKVQEQIEAAGGLRLLRLLLKEQKIRRKFDLIKTESLKTSLGDDEAYFTARAAVFKDNILAQEELVESYAEGTSERANAEIELFKLQDELRDNDLAKERAFIENKKSINSEYVGFAQGISSLLRTIAGENEAVQKAALLIEKGAAIAKIVINAQSSIASSRAFAAAVPLIIPPGVPNPAKPLAEADAAQGAIRTKVGAAIGIANILATTISSFKTPSSASGGGGRGSGGKTVVNAPDFNVVGASATNQLAQTVAGQVNTPLRAYVVGSDVQNQLSLDRQIAVNGSIG